MTEFFDEDVLDMMKSEKWSSIYLKMCENYEPHKNPLNPINLIRDFLNDLNLREDFKEYCKMRFGMVEEGDDIE